MKAILSIVNGVLNPVGLHVGRFPVRYSMQRLLRDLFAKLEINCVLDVGGHYGEYRHILRMNGYRGHIISFEPVAESFEILQKSAKGDTKWKGYRWALSDRDGAAEIHRYEASAFNSLQSPSEWGHTRFEHEVTSTGIEEVTLKRLDSVIDECLQGIPNPRIYLKVDTQGHDTAVLRGASGCMDRILAMQSELAEKRTYSDVPHMIDALSCYRELGFSPVGFFPVDREPDRVTVLEWDCVMIKAGAAGKY